MRILALFLFIAVTASCGKDDDPKPNDNTTNTIDYSAATPVQKADKIVGTWMEAKLASSNDQLVNAGNGKGTYFSPAKDSLRFWITDNKIDSTSAKKYYIHPDTGEIHIENVNPGKVTFNKDATVLKLSGFPYVRQ